MSNGINWQDLGWTGEAAESTGLQNLLGDFFADPAAQMKFFEDYDPSKEQMATQQMQLGQQQAQEQARGSMWKMFQQGRQGKSGFGGGQRAMQTAMSGIHKGLAQGREQAQLGLQQDISGLREGYRGDVMGMIGSLLGAGAEAAGAGGQTTGYDTSIYGEGFNQSTGECGPGYYMAGLDSGEQGCIPMSGTNDDGNTYGGNESSLQQECAAKNGIWFNGQCEFPGGGSGGTGGGVDDTMP